MKDYKTEVTNQFVKQLCDFADENNLNYEVFEGCLLDNYIFYDASFISFGKINPRKYIIIREKYLNEWSSTFEMIMTDDDKLLDKYYETFGGYELEEE